MDQIGESFQARYLQLEVNDMTEIPYDKGVYVIAFTEFSVYKDLILVGEAKLVPYTELAIATTLGATTITVDDTTGFSSSGTAYLNNDAFTYTGKTATTFTGCVGILVQAIDTRVSQEIETAHGGYTNLSSATTSGDVTVNVKDATDFAIKGTAYLEGVAFTYTGKTGTTALTGCASVGTHANNAKVTQSPTVYDKVGLLGRIGDKIYKDTNVNENLTTISKIYNRAYNWLYEFQKDHSKVSVNTVFAPHLRIGQTVKIVDVTNNISQRYFIESIQNTSGGLSLILARYP
jgi:hypothetical protein